MRSGSAPEPAPWVAWAGLGLAAAVLALIGLGDLPLRDFDEATVARVALELRHGLGEAGESKSSLAPNLPFHVAMLWKIP